MDPDDWKVVKTKYITTALTIVGVGVFVIVIWARKSLIKKCQSFLIRLLTQHNKKDWNESQLPTYDEVMRSKTK